MRCPKCNSKEVRVLESRTKRNDSITRRRRQCDLCTHKFTTYEQIEEIHKGCNGHYVFTDGQVRAIYKLKDWYSTQELAELFNCSLGSIQKIKQGKSKVLIDDGITPGDDPEPNYTQTKRMLKTMFLRFKRLNNQEFTDLLTDCLN